MARSDRDQKDRQSSRRRQPMERPGRRRPCYFCKEKIDEVDWKNFNQLRRYVSEKGKIRSRRIIGHLPPAPAPGRSCREARA